ncbi:phosphotransferase [Frigidibacter albus]|uniref:Phosphotransferase n=1 Tax=Frigidibacter albus TaxID=1465486 RepID=A0A6L8VIG3_9RHOB|nr:phosphotransferase [Frigidibacter albus]MZQ89521.1 phosphotransferase [Frigidibacter albus]NBE31427.1 phosphotransferase [Frigidibacter albus]GGH55516.1 hypothetical protein GCM10011341_23110 [Frigidibacter albus]
MSRTGLEQAAMALWPRLAAMAEVPVDGYAPKMLSWRDEPTRRRIVLEMTAPGHPPLVLKLAPLPADPALFSGSLAAQQAALRAMGGGVPRVLAALPESHALLMERVPGDTAAAIMEQATRPEQLDDALEACGAWLSRFHTATDAGMRAYRPRAVCDHLARQRDAVEAGRRQVPLAREFLALSDRVIAEGARYDGLPARAGGRHGDMNLRNLVLAGDPPGQGGAWGLDFAPAQSAPVGHDVARLLLNYAVTCTDPEQIPEGEVLPPRALVAFFKGYAFSGCDDASIGFLLRNQIVADWARIPAAAAKSDLLQQIRLAALRAIARRAFPDLR